MLHKFSDVKKTGYAVGPLLYMPALRTDIAEKLHLLKKSGLLSAAVCLEDTIRNDMVGKAEQNLALTLKSLCNSISAGKISPLSLPEIFIRVRAPEQLHILTEMCGESLKICGGFIFPKIDDETISPYLEQADKLKSCPCFMPIIENPSFLHPYKRGEKLERLREKLMPCRDKVLNIRVGGNDLCSSAGLHTDVYHTIYDAAPVAAVLSDICAVFSSEFTVSAPVWNYFGGEYWQEGMKREMEADKLYGFVGKTIIHPNQIAPALENMMVSPEDHKAAQLILNNDNEIQVLKSSGRMYENKVHSLWAEKILALGEIYGVRE